MTIESVARVETVIASGVGSKTVIARSEATYRHWKKEANKPATWIAVACATADFSLPGTGKIQTARDDTVCVRVLARTLALIIRGRNAGRSMRPQPRVQGRKHTSVVTTVTPDSPAFPAQWFTAYFALSPVTSLFDTVACLRLADLTWGVRTTTWPSASAPFVKALPRPPHTARVDDVANALEDGTGQSVN
jgi:hypothetical protein